MESLRFTILFSVLLKSNLVKSQNVKEEPESHIQSSRAFFRGEFVPDYGLYSIGITFALLLIVIIGLLVYIAYLKKKRYNISESIASITRRGNETHIRQTSTETQILLTPLPIRNNNVYLHPETLTTVDYNSSDTNYKLLKFDLLETKKPFINMPVRPLITPDEMKSIVTGVLDKTKCKEFTSLTNLDKIINEGQENMRDKRKLNVPQSSKVERCSSTPVLDIIMQQPESIECDKSSLNYLANSATKDKTGMSLNDSKLNKKIDTRIYVSDEIYNDLPNSNTCVLTNEIKAKSAKNTKRSSVDSNARLIDDSNGNKVYDNAPNHTRPVSSDNEIEDVQEDIYETGPSNRPLTLLSEIAQINNRVDENPKPEQNVDVISELMTKITCDEDNKEICSGNTTQEKDITCIRESKADYILALTKNTDACFEPSYTNAKLLKTTRIQNNIN